MLLFFVATSHSYSMFFSLYVCVLYVFRVTIRVLVLLGSGSGIIAAGSPAAAGSHLA